MRALPDAGSAAPLGDEALLDLFQRTAFGYFSEFVDRRTGLVPDRSRPDTPASIAVVGFALSCYPVGVERGWMEREEAAALTLAALRFFREAPQGREDDAAGFKGFFYHFLDMQTGRRAWNCELSMLDTALLIAGMLTAAAYFTGETDDEAEIRRLAEEIYLRVDWRWAQSNKVTIRHGWRPRCGFLPFGWDGYNEAAILYVLALGSPTKPASDDSYEGWTKTYCWEAPYGEEVLYGGPLFLDQFSHAWIDFRAIQDACMHERGLDYFENSRRATYLHREYSRRNPKGFKGYCEDLWGLSAGDGPGNIRAQVDGRRLRFWGYKARGAPHGPDDGTVTPWSCLASMPFAPEIGLSALRFLVERYPAVVAGARVPSGFNPTLAHRKGFGADGWISEGRFGLDQGIIVMMVENYRTDLIWRLTRAIPIVRKGLEKAGFTGGWLEKAAS